MSLSRRKARIVALEALYQLDISNGDINNIINAKLVSKNLSKGIKDFILKLVKGILEHRDEINNLIEANTENWSVDRIAVIDRNILMLASFELLYCPDVPFKVVIDEAIELAKTYGTEDSGAFINGILDKLGKGIVFRKQEINLSLQALSREEIA